jgi:hypothetical protein
MHACMIKQYMVCHVEVPYIHCIVLLRDCVAMVRDCLFVTWEFMVNEVHVHKQCRGVWKVSEGTYKSV